MSDFEILLAEMTDSGVLDLSDHVRRCPSVWFVNRDDNPIRVVLDVSAQRCAARIEYECFQSKLFTRDFVDSVLVAAAFELFGKPCICNLDYSSKWYETCWHYEYIGVVMLLDELSDLN